MPLLDLKTNLKSLKFGFDLPAGGSSKQPFVEKPIPSDDEPTPGASPDYLLRQGTLRRIVDDETRFFKYFTSTPGLAFIGKQNLLSLTSVRTQASKGPSNQGVYLPTSTAAQLAANPFGGHLNFLGVDPTGLIPGISITKYGDLTKPILDIGGGGSPEGIAKANNNRLVNLSKDLGLIDKKAESQTGLGGALQSARNFLSGGKTILYSYPGGPGAAEGIGKTNIYRYSFTGLDNPLAKNNPSYFFGKNNNKIHTPDDPSTWVNIPLGATDYYNGKGLADLGQSGLETPSSFLGSTFFVKGKTDILTTSRTEVWGEETIADESLPTIPGVIRDDFRKKLRTDTSTLPTQELLYSGNKALDKRLNQGNPGARGNITNYTAGKKDENGNSPYRYGLDEINALPLYQSSTGEAKTSEDGPVNDLIKFRIASVNNNDPKKAVYTHFRAFIDSFSDSYGTNWSGERYPGRGEEFFRYGGFTRGISLSFTVAAQSKEELIPMYKKLNFLASNTMNDYSNSGYMRAPFIRLTIGGYLYEQFGFLRGINYGWEMAAPFEIGINTKGEYDSNVKELPHVIRVTGFEFQPIYDFLPQKQTNIYAGQSTDSDGDVTQFGKQRYIALANGLGEESSNYGSEFVPQTLDSVFTPTPIPPLNVPSTLDANLDINKNNAFNKASSLGLNVDPNIDVDIPNLSPLPGTLRSPNFNALSL